MLFLFFLSLSFFSTKCTARQAGRYISFMRLDVEKVALVIARPRRGRGNLAGSLRIFGKLRRIRNILCEISTSLRPLAMTGRGPIDKPGTVWESQTVKKPPLCRIMPTSYRNNLLQGKRVYAIMQKKRWNIFGFLPSNLAKREGTTGAAGAGPQTQEERA